MLWKEQGVTVLAVSAVYDVFVFHRLKMKHILPTIYKVSDCWCSSIGFLSHLSLGPVLPFERQMCSFSKRT